MATRQAPSTAVIAITVTLVLHFTWEMVQAPAFAPFAEGVWSGTVRCFQAAVGDVFLASGAYAVTAIVFRRPMWLVGEQRWLAPSAIWIAFNLVATAALERWAVENDRWQYGSAMPTLFAIGLLPLLQWLIVPTLTIVAVRRIVRAGRK